MQLYVFNGMYVIVSMHLYVCKGIYVLVCMYWYVGNGMYLMVRVSRQASRQGGRQYVGTQVPLREIGRKRDTPPEIGETQVTNRESGSLPEKFLRSDGHRKIQMGQGMDGQKK